MAQGNACHEAQVTIQGSVRTAVRAQQGGGVTPAFGGQRVGESLQGSSSSRRVRWRWMGPPCGMLDRQSMGSMRNE